jgi:thioredoxin-like negative regulator of GroEL
MADTPPFDALETEEEIDAIMREGGGTVVIDFWSETCGPCLAMAADFEHVAAQFDRSEVRFCKVDTEHFGNLAAPFRIRSIPTLLFIHDGKILDAVVGKMSSSALGEKTEWLLAKAAKASRPRKGLLARMFG